MPNIDDLFRELYSKKKKTPKKDIMLFSSDTMEKEHLSHQLVF